MNNQMKGRTCDAALRLYNGYTIHQASFKSLCARGLAELRHGAEQHLTDAGRRFIATGVIPK